MTLYEKMSHVPAVAVCLWNAMGLMEDFWGVQHTLSVPIPAAGVEDSLWEGVVDSPKEEVTRRFPIPPWSVFPEVPNCDDGSRKFMLGKKKREEILAYGKASRTKQKKAGHYL
jgi:hypothetical protein